MKNNHIFIYALLMLLLGACSSAKFNGINKVDDDVYWSTKDEPKSAGKNIKDVEPWNKSKGPNATSYEPIEQNNSASSDQSYTDMDDERGRNAYQAWQNRSNSRIAEDTSKQSNVWVSNNDNERDARRFGSDRNYYYDDPYYNVLSNNWGWTSFYSPMVRPGFYNWAPGWNVGLSWNSFNGFGVNMGYNMGWGGMGYGYNPWYGPQFGGFYPPFYDPFYQPFYNPYYGYGGFYNPYGYPYGFYHPYAYGNRWGYCNNYNRYGRYYGRNDVVTNRPIIRPRNSMGSVGGSSGGTASRPRGSGVDEQRVYSNRPNTYVPERAEMKHTNSGRSNRPGGDLYYDEAGKPVYVSPNRRPSSGGSEPTNTYSNRPGGDLRPGSDGKPVYIPARPRGEEVNPGRPGNSPERSRGAENGSFEPRRPPVYSAPSQRGNSPRNSGDAVGRPSYSAPSAPAQRPSYSSPSNSRPSSSPTPSSRPSSSPGGNVRPR